MITRYFTLLAVCFVLVSPLSAQREPPPGDMTDPTEDQEDAGPFFARITFDYGLTYVRPWRMNDALFDAGTGFDHLYGMGFTFGEGEKTTSDEENVFFGYDGGFSFHRFTPCLKVARVNNTETYFRLRGWELMTSLYGVNFMSPDPIDIVIGVGGYWGNLKMDRTTDSAGTETKRYTNPFVAPMVRAEVRFNFSVFTLGGRFSYRYDITNENWKRKDEGLNPLPGYKFCELQYLFFIGFRFYGSDE